MKSTRDDGARRARIASILGMSGGCAANRLRKALLFSFAQRLGLTICFRCGDEIAHVDDFSIDHKVAWEYHTDAPSIFFDLNNISFSHLRCNSNAANRGRRVYEDVKVRRAAKYQRFKANEECYQIHLRSKRKNGGRGRT